MTVPDVFIIESLSKVDEMEHRYEGQRLADILRLSGKNPKYVYFQSVKELPLILDLYKLSDYRYLHISCHASDQSVFTTNDKVSYAEFSRICAGYLKLRRVFFSACEVGNELFSVCLAGANKGMHSIAAPAEEIYFDHAAAIWGAFYVSVFSKNSNSMNSADIGRRLTTLCSLFPVNFHFSTYHSVQDAWNHRLILKNTPAKTTARARVGETISSKT